eukprot:gene3621-2558_t
MCTYYYPERGKKKQVNSFIFRRFNDFITSNDNEGVYIHDGAEDERRGIPFSACRRDPLGPPPLVGLVGKRGKDAALGHHLSRGTLNHIPIRGSFLLLNKTSKRIGRLVFSAASSRTNKKEVAQSEREVQKEPLGETEPYRKQVLCCRMKHHEAETMHGTSDVAADGITLNIYIYIYIYIYLFIYRNICIIIKSVFIKTGLPVVGYGAKENCVDIHSYASKMKNKRNQYCLYTGLLFVQLLLPVRWDSSRVGQGRKELPQQ